MPPQTLLLPAFAAGQSQITTDRSIPLLSRVGPAEPCGLCRVKSRMADSARLVTGVSPGRSWNFASRSGPLMTAVVRWSMPQLCPKITSLPAQSPYILFKRSRAASCGSGSSEPSSGSCFVANCQQPARQPRPAAGDRAGRPAVLAMAGQRSPVAEVADRLAAVRQHISPGGALCAAPPTSSDAYCPFRTNGTNYPSQCSVRAPLSEGGVSHGTRCRPRASLEWTSGSATALETRRRAQPCRALSPVLIQAVRDTPRR
jgi:hypothetical protein